MFKGKDDLTGAQTLQRQDKNERLQIPDLDMKMLDMILQGGTEGSPRLSSDGCERRAH